MAIGTALVLFMMIYSAMCDCPGGNGPCDCCSCCGGATIFGGCAGACFGGCPGASNCAPLCGGLTVGQIFGLAGLSTAYLASLVATAGATSTLGAAVAAGSATGSALGGGSILFTNAQGEQVTINPCSGTGRRLESVDDNALRNTTSHAMLSKFICSYGNGTVSGNNMCVLSNNTADGMERNDAFEVGVVESCTPYFDNGVANVNVTGLNMEQNVELLCPKDIDGVPLRSLELWTPGTTWVNPFGNEPGVMYSMI